MTVPWRGATLPGAYATKISPQTAIFMTGSQSYTEDTFSSIVFDTLSGLTRNMQPLGPAGAYTGFLVPRTGLYVVSLTLVAPVTVDEGLSFRSVLNGVDQAIISDTADAAIPIGGLIRGSLEEYSEGDEVGIKARFKDSGGGTRTMAARAGMYLIPF